MFGVLVGTTAGLALGIFVAVVVTLWFFLRQGINTSFDVPEASMVLLFVWVMTIVVGACIGWYFSGRGEQGCEEAGSS